MIILSIALSFAPVGLALLENAGPQGYPSTGSQIGIAAFCVPWYEPCKRLTSELELATESLKLWSIPVDQVDCDKVSELCASHGVVSYPTIRIVERNEHTRFRGSFKSSSIVAAALRRSPSDYEMVDKRKLGVLKSLDIPLLMLNPSLLPRTTEELDYIGGELADEIRTKFILVVPDEGTARDEGIETSLFTAYNKMDEVSPVYTGKLAAKDILSWAEKVSTPLIARLDLPGLARYMQSGLPLAMVFSEKEEERKALAIKLIDVAIKYKGRVNIVTVDAVELSFLAEPLGLALGKYPALVLQTDAETFQYDEKQMITSETVDTFIKQSIYRQAEES